jgi:hypothetical protein
MDVKTQTMNYDIRRASLVIHKHVNRVIQLSVDIYIDQLCVQDRLMSIVTSLSRSMRVQTCLSSDADGSPSLSVSIAETLPLQSP